MPQAAIHASSRSGRRRAVLEGGGEVEMLVALEGGSAVDGSRAEGGGIDSGEICGGY